MLVLLLLGDLSWRGNAAFRPCRRLVQRGATTNSSIDGALEKLASVDLSKHLLDAQASVHRGIQRPAHSFTLTLSSGLTFLSERAIPRCSSRSSIALHGIALPRHLLHGTT